MDTIMNKVSHAPLPVLVAIGVVVVVVVLALLSKRMDMGTSMYTPHFKKVLQNLIQQSTRWSTVAGQDQNPVVALMHVNYALGFIKAARRLASDSDIAKITGSNVTELHYIMENQQADLISIISEKCPELGLQGVVALNAGWTG